MDYINDLHELCETLSKEIGEANRKIRNAGGKLTAGDVDFVDKLTHAMKSAKAVLAMAENEDGYSSRGGSYYGGGSYRGMSYDGGGSYARGRRNAPRDSMGRYSGDGYSRREGMAEELREMMQDAPDDVRRELGKIVQKMEQG